MAERRPVSVPVPQPQVMFMAASKLGDHYGPGLAEKLAWVLARVLFAMRSWFFDLIYNSMPEWMLDEALARWREEVLPGLPYQGEYTDCDDFAARFNVWLRDYARGNGIPAFNGVGMAIGYLEKDGAVLGGHAWNVVLVTGEAGTDLVFVEPQTGERVEGGVSPDGYRYRLLAVIM